MIEFEGKVSQKCHHYIARRMSWLAFLSFKISGITVFTIAGICLVMGGIHWHVPLVASILLLIFVDVLILRYAYGKEVYPHMVPDKVSIRGDGTIVCKGESFAWTENVKHATCVWDMGDWYHIKFKKRNGQGCFVCQKSLLTKGTIEEFEALFEGKIVRKCKLFF